jgi:hypothetical protein
VRTNTVTYIDGIPEPLATSDWRTTGVL